MPPTFSFDASLPLLARALPLTAALLSAWEHEGLLLGDYSHADARRMDWQRTEILGLPSAL